jgi:flagellar motor switch protein FliN/FliY
MSPTTVTTDTADVLGYLEEETAACWHVALESSFGSEGCALNIQDTPTSPEDCWFTCNFSPAQFGSLEFGLNRITAVALGHLLLSARGRSSEHDHHALHATTHLLGQLAATLARKLAARVNTTLAAADCSPAVNAPDAPHRFTVPFGDAQGRNHLLTVCPSPALLSALAKSTSPAANTAVVAGSRSTPRNLDLLLDLEMPVSVSFGTTRLALKDVAKLTTGSIVELNRALSEPVDIIVNNCAIARGEVVVVDGNFAVRIQQVISKQDRLRSLS